MKMNLPVAVLAALFLSATPAAASPDEDRATVAALDVRYQAAVKANDAERARAARWGVEDLDRIYHLEELARGDVIFAATGVTDGSLLEGVKRRKDCITTESVVMRASTGTVRWVKGRHRPDHEPGLH